MPRDFFKRIAPSEREVRDHRYLRMFGTALHDGRLWHLNRRTAAGGVALGLFLCWVPIPIQMLLAAVMAVLLRVNLPLAVLGVWITNPLTFAPMFYFAYRLGSVLVGSHPINIPPELTLEFLTAQLSQIWWPMLAGCGLLAVVFSAIGYFTVSVLWRIHVMRKFKRRHEERRFKLKLPKQIPEAAAHLRDQIKDHVTHHHAAPDGSRREPPTRDRESQ